MAEVTMQSDATDIKFSKRLSGNLITNIVVLILNTCIGLFMTPFFLDTLGEVAYGIIPLATSVTSYVTLIVSSLNSSVSRYLMIDLRRGDFNAAQTTFNTAFFGVLAFVIIILPIAVLIAFLSPIIFNIGTLNSTDVIFLFFLVLVSSLITVIAGNFMVTLQSYNRLDLRNIVTIVQQIVQVGLLISLFAIVNPRLPFVGVAYISASILSLILASIFSKSVCKELKVSKRSFSKARAKDIGLMSMWTMVANIGTMLRVNTALVLVNLFCGAVVAAQYSIAYTGQTLCLSIVSTITTIFIPMIYTYAGVDDKKGLVDFISLAVKCSCLFMGVVLGVAFVYLPDVLAIWVGGEYSSLAFLAALLMLPSIVHAGYSCIVPISSAYLKVREVAIMVCSFGIFALFLYILFLIVFDLGVYGVALSMLIIAIIGEGFIIPRYVAAILKANQWSFITPMIPGIIMFVVALILSSIVKFLIPLSSILNLLFGGTVVLVLYIFICTTILLNKKEKGMIRACIPKSLEKYVPQWIL